MRSGLLAAVAFVGIAASIALAGCAPAMPAGPGGSGDGVSVSSPSAELPSAEVAPRQSDPEPMAAPTVATEDGAIEIGEGMIEIDMWVDFFCPYCGMFEDANGDYLQSLVEEGDATLRIHPIAILNRAAMGTRYSTRAANAFVCAAEHAPAEALATFRELYRVQPPEPSEGLADDELVRLAPPAAEDCIRDEHYGGWVDEWTARSLEAGVQGTPTVLVDGKRFPGGFDHRDFLEFVEPPGSAPIPV